MKILRLLTCLLSLLNLQNHIYCQREYSPQLAEYLQRAGRPTVIQHFSTFGETKEDYDAKGSNIVDFVTLKTDLKSSFFSKGRFCQSIESFYLSLICNFNFCCLVVQFQLKVDQSLYLDILHMFLCVHPNCPF